MSFTFKNRLLTFLFLKLLNPLSLIIITYILARYLPTDDVAIFLLIYSLSVIFSAISDGGARVSHFAHIRKSKDNSEHVSSLYLECILVKFIFSILLVPVLILGLYHFYDGYSLELGIAVWLYSISMPIGDPAWIILRGLGDVSVEIKSNFVEQFFVILGILILIKLSKISLTNVYFLLAMLGISRLVFSQIKVARFLNLQQFNVQVSLKKIVSIFLYQFWTFKSVLMSNCFNRLPIIFFSGFLSTSSFVVFSSFYTLFMRGELILGAAIQALWGEKNNYNNNKLLRICFCGFLMGLVIVFCCWFFGRQIVELYLGGSYSGSYNTILLPAIYMCLYFPFFVLRTDIMYEGQTRAVSICLIFGIFIQALCSKIDFSFNALKMASFPISITFVALLYYLIRKRKLL